ncbi:MAG TPA: ERF family protein [Trueperaceae bacterium]
MPTLAAKLAKVMEQVKYIQKRGKNAHFGYTYATEADVADKVREVLAQQGVAVLPNVLPETIQIRETQTARGRTEYILTAVYEVTFVDGETGEKLTVRTIGQGQDAGDKAGYKATTGAMKYALMKAFLIPTGDDPEDDSGDAAPTQADEKRAPAKAQDGDRDKAMRALFAVAKERDLSEDEVHVLAYAAYERAHLSDLTAEQLRRLAARIKRASEEALIQTISDHGQAWLEARGGGEAA